MAKNWQKSSRKVVKKWHRFQIFDSRRENIRFWKTPYFLGNTVRGVQFAKELIRTFNFHRFDNLFKHGCKLDPRKFKNEHLRQSTLSLLYSATAGDLTALKRFYYSGVNMSNANYDGRTALHLAAAEGHASCVKFLVETCKLSPLAKDRWVFWGGRRPT